MLSLIVLRLSVVVGGAWASGSSLSLSIFHFPGAIWPVEFQFCHFCPIQPMSERNNIAVCVGDLFAYPDVMASVRTGRA
jgi:hypothetical protein